MLYRLLDNGVDINSRHDLGWGAIHAAVVNKAMRCVTVCYPRDVNFHFLAQGFGLLYTRSVCQISNIVETPNCRIYLINFITATQELYV